MNSFGGFEWPIENEVRGIGSKDRLPGETPQNYWQGLESLCGGQVQTGVKMRDPCISCVQWKGDKQSMDLICSHLLQSALKRCEFWRLNCRDD